jgi:hypothetical protein
MHGLTPSSFDHGASLDAASAVVHHNHNNKNLIHNLVAAIRDQVGKDPEVNMPAASNLAELKGRLCLREG